MQNEMRKAPGFIAALMATWLCAGAGTAMAQPVSELNAYRAYLNTMVAGWRGAVPSLEWVELALRPDSRQVKQQTERVVFSDIMFASDSEKLSDVGVGRCYLIAQKLKRGTSVKVVIQGHTDHRGSSNLNQKLGVLRAEAVKSQLESFGIPESRMSTVSSGQTSSGADQRADWARATDDRTEFEIDAEEGTSSNQSSESTTNTTF